jgi:NAD-dependent oxidoreductase involved in siderophore biosynthesis
MAFGRFWKKYWVVIFFPTVTAGSIFSDLAHTRQWKQQQAKLKATAKNSVL